MGKQTWAMLQRLGVELAEEEEQLPHHDGFWGH